MPSDYFDTKGNRHATRGTTVVYSLDTRNDGRTASFLVVFLVTSAVPDFIYAAADPYHVGGDVVVVHTFGTRVDASEASIATALASTGAKSWWGDGAFSSIVRRPHASGSSNHANNASEALLRGVQPRNRPWTPRSTAEARRKSSISHPASSFTMLPQTYPRRASHYRDRPQPTKASPRRYKGSNHRHHSLKNGAARGEVGLGTYSFVASGTLV